MIKITPQMRLADLLTGSYPTTMVLRDRNLIIGLSFWPVSADSIGLFFGCIRTKG